MASRRRYTSTQRSVGLEAALQHIEEAKQLSKELGGTDKDVKEYFFSLSPKELQTIWDKYQANYGEEPRNYAEITLPKWRSGKVQMSGLVAGRLFSLLPPLMPISAKYALTKNLWEHMGPSSRKTLRIGLNGDITQVVEAVRAHIEEVVINYKIPDGLENRFNWLSEQDVHVKQDLLNNLLVAEKNLVVEGAQNQLPTMLAHMGSLSGEQTHRLAQVLKLGKHELEILIDKNSIGVTLEEPPVMIQSLPSMAKQTQSSKSSNDFFNWLFWTAGIAFVVFLLIKMHPA